MANFQIALQRLLRELALLWLRPNPMPRQPVVRTRSAAALQAVNTTQGSEVARFMPPWRLIQPATVWLPSIGTDSRAGTARVLVQFRRAPVQPRMDRTTSCPAISARSSWGMTVSSKPRSAGPYVPPLGQRRQQILPHLGLDAAFPMPGGPQLAEGAGGGR